MAEPKTMVFLNRAEEIAYDRAQAEKNKEKHGDVLPFKETDEGIKWGLPKWMMDTQDAITLPRDAIEGYQPTGKDVANFALSMGVGGMGSSAVTAPVADVGMFLGKDAAGADKKKLAIAIIQDSRGVDREQIWRDTGYWKKPDGEWAWEMADDDLAINPDVMETLKFVGSGRTSGRGKDIIHYPRLFDQYAPISPEAASKMDQIPYGVDDPTRDLVDYVSLEVNPLTETRGQAVPHTGYISLTVGEDGKARELVAHELQHMVQAKEHWKGLGYNPEAAQQMIDEVDKMAPESWHNFKHYEKEINFAEDKITDFSNKRSLAEEALKKAVEEDDVLTQVSLEEDLINNEADLFKWTEYVEQMYEGRAKAVADPSFGPYKEAREIFEEQFGKTAYEIYRNNEGEALANLTAQRLSLTPEERKLIPPWLMYGSPDPIFKDQNIPWEDRLWKEGDFSKFKQKLKITPPADLPKFRVEIGGQKVGELIKGDPFDDTLIDAFNSMVMEGDKSKLLDHQKWLERIIGAPNFMEIPFKDRDKYLKHYDWIEELFSDSDIQFLPSKAE